MKRRDLLYSLLFVASGCATANLNSNSTSVTPPTLERLRLAISDVKGTADLEKDYGKLRDLLAEILKTKVEFFPVDGYLSVVPALQLDQVDLVFTGPSEYVVMQARSNAIPIVAVQRQEYYAVIAARADGGIQSAADLKGKTIALTEVGSTSGYLGPIKLLVDAGLDPKSDIKIQLLGKDGIDALAKGDVDAWGGSAIRYKNVLKSKKLVDTSFPIIAQGQPLPPDPFVVNSRLNQATIDEISKQLLQHDRQLIAAIEAADYDKFVGGKLVAVNDKDFDVIREAYKAVGQDAFLKG